MKIIGPHIADYDKLRLKFMQDGRFTPLQGDTNLTLGTTHLHHIRRMLQTNAVAEIFTMQLIEPVTYGYGTRISLEVALIKDTFPIPTVDELYKSYGFELVTFALLAQRSNQLS